MSRARSGRTQADGGLEHLGPRLCNLRRIRGLRTAELAERVGVSVRTLNSWLGQGTCPPVWHLLALARALEVTVDELLDPAVRPRAYSDRAIFSALDDLRRRRSAPKTARKSV